MDGSLPFLNRSAAEGATVDPLVEAIDVLTPSGFVLQYRRDATGTALTTDGGTVNWSPAGAVYPDHWGENTTPGTTDMTVITQSAIDWLGAGETLNFFEGVTFRYDGTVVITHDDFTLNDKGAKFDGSNLALSFVVNDPDAIFEITGSNRASTTLAVSASKGDTAVTLSDASAMQVGDPIEFARTTLGPQWYTSGINRVDRYCVNKIVAIAGNVVTLSWPLPLDLVVNHPVNAWNTVKRFRTTGGTYQGGGVRNNPLINALGSAAFKLEYIEDCDIELGYIEGFQGFCIRARYFMDLSVNGGVMRGHTEDYPEATEGQDSGFYGVFPAFGHGFRWSNTVGHRLRHMQDGAYMWSADISGLKAYRSNRPSFGSHEGCTDFTFRGCASDDQRGGVLWRGHNVKVIGCTFSAQKGNGNGFYDTAGAATDVPKTIELVGNDFRGHRRGVQLVGNIGVFRSQGNNYSSAETSPGYFPVEVDTLDLGEFFMLGDTVDALAGSFCVDFADVTPRTRKLIKIKDCKLTGYGTAPVRVFGAAAGTDIFYEDNHVDDTRGLVFDNVGAGIVNEANYAPGGVQVPAIKGTWTPRITSR